MINLKKEHPQKYYLKLICDGVFYLGLGTYWYEQNETKYPHLYRIWGFTVNGYTVCVVLNQFLAYFRTDLSPDEKSGLILYGFGQFLVLAKFLVMYLNRGRIIDVLKNLLENNREVFRSSDLDRESIKKAKFFCYPYIFVTLLTLVVTTTNAIRHALFEGGPVQIVPTFYPMQNSSGVLTYVIRFFLVFHFWVFVFVMILSESLCYCCLTFVRFKFSLVQLYFQRFHENYIETCEEKFEKCVISGIKLHEDALWCATNVQRALGTVYGIQMCECISLLAVGMVGLINADRNLTGISASVLYIGCLSFLTACYMIPSGDITYEAAQIPTAIFHSGWERVRARRRLRALLVVAIMRAQQPVHMTAFGVLDLSYESFILVLRTSYSFFAVMY